MSQLRVLNPHKFLLLRRAQVPLTPGVGTTREDTLMTVEVTAVQTLVRIDTKISINRDTTDRIILEVEDIIINPTVLTITIAKILHACTTHNKYQINRNNITPAMDTQYKINNCQCPRDYQMPHRLLRKADKCHQITLL